MLNFVCLTTESQGWQQHFVVVAVLDVAQASRSTENGDK
jgi:hypothetical protein